MNRLKIAVIGCGAVTEVYHLPVIAASRGVALTALVDRHLPRAQQLAAAYGARMAADDHRAIAGQADAAIVAVPNHLHAPVTLDLLDRGIHVLVEKPMALRAADCREMTERAERKGVVLAVGHTRRFGWAAQFVKRALASRMLGRAISCDVREGVEYAWKVRSAFPFRRETGGGVLADIGIHVIDLLLWWFGDGDVVAYHDDAMGGVEAECKLEMRFGGAVAATVELSRTRTLRNTVIVSCERGSLEIGTESNPVVRLRVGGKEPTLSGEVSRRGQSDRRTSRPQTSRPDVPADPVEVFSPDWAGVDGAGAGTDHAYRRVAVHGVETRRNEVGIDQVVVVKQHIEQHAILDDTRLGASAREFTRSRAMRAEGG